MPALTDSRSSFRVSATTRPAIRIRSNSAGFFSSMGLLRLNIPGIQSGSGRKCGKDSRGDVVDDANTVNGAQEPPLAVVVDQRRCALVIDVEAPPNSLFCVVAASLFGGTFRQPLQQLRLIDGQLDHRVETFATGGEELIKDVGLSGCTGIPIKQKSACRVTLVEPRLHHRVGD